MTPAVFLSSLFSALVLGAMLLVFPWCVGNIFFPHGERDRGLVYILGMCSILAAFEILYIPFFFLKQSFTMLTVVFFILLVLASVWGFMVYFRQKAVPAAEKMGMSRGEKLWLGGFVLLFIYQALRLTAGAGTWNIDDAWYLTIANDALFYDKIMGIDPVSGYPLDYTQNLHEGMEYIFSPWPIFWAMFAKVLSFSITSLMRTVLPFYFIAIFYYVFYRFARFIFADNREKALMALCLGALFFELSAVAMNLRFTWAILYPWMGKSFGPSVICPAALWLFLQAEREEEKSRARTLWLGVFIANLAGCVTSSSCAELSLIALGCWGLVSVIEKKDLSLIWKLGLCVSPSLVLMVTHFI